MRLTWTVDTQSEVGIHFPLLTFTIAIPECLRLLHQLRHTGRLSGQRRDPAQHGDRGHPQHDGHHHQPGGALLLPRHLHTSH